MTTWKQSRVEMLDVQLSPLTSYVSTSFSELTQFKSVPQQNCNLLHRNNSRPVKRSQCGKGEVLVSQCLWYTTKYPRWKKRQYMYKLWQVTFRLLCPFLARKCDQNGKHQWNFLYSHIAKALLHQIRYNLQLPGIDKLNNIFQSYK